MTVIITENKQRVGLIVHSGKAFGASGRRGRNICEITVKLNGVPLYLGSHTIGTCRRLFQWLFCVLVGYTCNYFATSEANRVTINDMFQMYEF